MLSIICMLTGIYLVVDNDDRSGRGYLGYVLIIAGMFL